MTGWIILDRKIFDNFLYFDRPFCRLAAFVDMILLANHEDKDILFDGEVFHIPRGSFLTSIRKLCDRWGWSNTKVNKFLNVLKKQQMITTNADKKKTLVSLVNYGKYQLSKDTETSLKRQRNDTETSLKHTNNNDNNDNNDKKKKMTDIEGRIFTRCVACEIQNVNAYKNYIFKYVELLSESDIMIAIETSHGKHAKYLLSVLETKTKTPTVTTPTTPKKRNTKPKLTIGTTPTETLSDSELEELNRLAAQLDGGKKQ